MKSWSTAFHHERPPRTTPASATPPSPAAIRLRHTRAGSGSTPGASAASRTAAAMIVSAPIKRNRPNAASPAATGFCSSRRRVAIACTGTMAAPVPAGPVTVTFTPYEPPVISHRAASYTDESPDTTRAVSGGGGAAVRGFQ